MKGKKRQSKRLTLKKKYKILRKVREHKRKVRKDSKVASRKGRKEKEPELPNNYPFKAEALAALEQRKLKEELEKELEKERLKKYQQAKKQKAIEKQRKVKEEALRRKQKLRELGQKVYGRCSDIAEKADIIVEVLDARDPLGCISRDLEEQIRTIYGDKLFVRLLNKIDLVPKENVLKWLDYLRKELPVLAIKCPVKQKQKKQKNFMLPQESEEAQVLRITSKSCVGLENLVQLCKNYAAHENKPVTVGVVGWSNVGKSSLLAQLRKHQDERVPSDEEDEVFYVADNIRVLGYTGEIIPSSELSEVDLCFRGCTPPLKATRSAATGAVARILNLVDKEQLLAFYKIGNFESVKQFLELVADRRGIKAKGKSGTTLAAQHVLNDWLQGRIKFFSEPSETTTSTPTSNGVWQDKVGISKLQAEEERAIYPLLKNELHLFTACRAVQLFNPKVESKFLDSFGSEQMDEDSENGEDEMDELANEASSSVKNHFKAGMNLEDDFDFADFEVTGESLVHGEDQNGDGEEDGEEEGVKEREEEEEEEDVGSEGEDAV